MTCGLYRRSSPFLPRLRHIRRLLRDDGPDNVVRAGNYGVEDWVRSEVTEGQRKPGWSCVPASLLILAACTQERPASLPNVTALSDQASSRTSERFHSFKPTGSGPSYMIPTSAQIIRRSGAEGPVRQIIGSGWKIIFAVSPTVSLKGLGMGQVLSRSPLPSRGDVEIVKFLPNPPVQGFRVSAASIYPLPTPAGINTGAQFKLLAQALCNEEAACNEAMTVLRSAK